LTLKKVHPNPGERKEPETGSPDYDYNYDYDYDSTNDGLTFNPGFCEFVACAPKETVEVEEQARERMVKVKG